MTEILNEEQNFAQKENINTMAEQLMEEVLCLYEKD